MAMTGRNPKDHGVPTLLPQAGPPTSTFNTRPGYLYSIPEPFSNLLLQIFQI